MKNKTPVKTKFLFLNFFFKNHYFTSFFVKQKKWFHKALKTKYLIRKLFFFGAAENPITKIKYSILRTCLTQMFRGALYQKIYNTVNPLLINYNAHRFHILPSNILPLLASVLVACFLSGQVCWWHMTLDSNLVYITKWQIHMSSLGVLFVSWFWAYLILKESSEGHHTPEVQKGLTLGFYLFLISEIMLFFSFFWSYFWFSINPIFFIGSVWPPKGTQLVSAWGLPLFNTIVLLLSGITITLAHRVILNRSFNHNTNLRFLFFKYVNLTIILGVIFLISQKWEYMYGLSAMWGNNVFWSSFFLLTGFHGFHVFLGVLLLLFNAVRFYFYSNVLLTKTILHFFYYTKQKLFNILYLEHCMFYKFHVSKHILAFFRNVSYLNDLFKIPAKNFSKNNQKLLKFFYIKGESLLNIEIFAVNTDEVEDLSFTDFQILKFLAKHKWTAETYDLVEMLHWFGPDIRRNPLKLYQKNTWTQYWTVFDVKLPNLTLFHLTSQQHLGFEVALFYWHFVDVVWIFLYISVYIWGF